MRGFALLARRLLQTAGAHGRILLTAGVILAAARANATNTNDPLAQLLAATFKISGHESSATCFLLQPPATAGWSNGAAILITAAHALAEFPGAECRLVLRSSQGEGGWLRHEVSLPIRTGDQPRWVRLPDADVAALRWTVPAGVTCHPLPYERLARPADFTNGRVALGGDAWIFSFPAQLEANDAGLPVLRHGAVSSLPLAPLGKHGTFLVDFATFGGDSGAPVLLYDRGRPEVPALVAGVVLGLHRQTDKVTMPFEERTVHHPLGLAFAAHADVVRRTVDLLLK